MNIFRQVVAITAMNLRSVPLRLGASSVIVIGITAVVGVVVSVLGMTRSLSHTLVDTGRADRAVVLRGRSGQRGRRAQCSSTPSPHQERAGYRAHTARRRRRDCGDARGREPYPQGRTARARGLPCAASSRRRNGPARDPDRRGTNVPAWPPRDDRGQSAHAGFRGVEIGDQVALRDSEWTIVGVFSSGGDASESRLMTDAATLLSAYQRTASNSVTVLLESGASFDEFKTALTTNPRCPSRLREKRTTTSASRLRRPLSS